MEKSSSLYAPENLEIGRSLVLNEEQKDAVRGITLGIIEVDEEIRDMAIEDVIRTLENGHPLNRLITADNEEIRGYIACEDFVPHEAYIKYFGTTRQTGRSLLREIPTFLEYAQRQGYTRLNFHGWNERLNHILERYGFQRIRTDNMAGYSVDYYEKSLGKEKSPQQINEDHKKAFEQKYINELNQKYQQILASFSKENRLTKEQAVNNAFQLLSTRLFAQQDFTLGERQQIILRLKLARHFQKNDTMDLNTLFDAIIESPKFITTDKGSLDRLLEVHQEKTLLAIAENRKRKAEMGDSETMNPWENLFQTESGNYYVARLLNMPHLKEESEYMNHCVGTSDSYISKMKRGEIEILSFRTAPKFNRETQRIEGDTPLITMEYNLKTKVIEQMKKEDDEYLGPDDPYFKDVMDALKQLRMTRTDTGQSRDFSKISDSELDNITVKDDHILTENGEIHFRDFNPEDDGFVLKMGEMEITSDRPREDIAKIIRIVGKIDCKPENIALSHQEITENTKIYIGEFSVDLLQSNIEHMYTSFPEREVNPITLEIGGKTVAQLQHEIEKVSLEIPESQGSVVTLNDLDFTTSKDPEKLNLVSLYLSDLGLDAGSTTEQVYKRAEELGLELCPAEVGPHLALKAMTESMRGYYRIAMKPIANSAKQLYIFALYTGDHRFLLDNIGAEPEYGWDRYGRFVFRFRKKNSKT